MINKELLKLLKNKGQVLDFEADSKLLSVGSHLESFVFVLEGELKVYLSGSTGKRKTLYWVRENECCLLGVNCLVNSVSYPASAKTTEDSKILMLPKKQFDILMDSIEFRELIFRMQSQRLDETLNLLVESAFHDLDFRVARYLARKAKSCKIVNVTHLEASEDLGASRERVSRSFKSLENQGFISSQEKGSYKIYLKKIEEIFSM